MTASPFTPRELVGLLADNDRRAVFAALALGADDDEAVRRATGLDARTAGRALQRLVDGGLVVRGDDGSLVLLGEAFALVARCRSRARTAFRRAHRRAGRRRTCVARFVRDGRLVSIPAVHAKRLVVLDWLVQRFEPGRRYSEQMVNLILGQVHPDTAALRRYLVDDGFLSRERGEYWRSGGSYEPDS